MNHLGKLSPAPGRVFIRINPPVEEVTSGGVIVPEAVGQNVLDCSGVIEQVGEGVDVVKVGNRVLFDIALATDSPLDPCLKIIEAEPGKIIGVLGEETKAELLSTHYLGQYRVQ